MGQLHFYYGTMASAKSGRLLMTCHQYTDCGTQCVLLKPSFDTRDTEGHINSRAVQSKPCTLIHPDTNIVDLVKPMLDLSNPYICVFVDEVQFLSKEQIYQLWEISKLTETTVDVYCYGLKTTYLNTLFEASSTLWILAEHIECLPSMCSYCHNDATTHLRIVNNKVIKEGTTHIIGDIANGKEYYKSVCQCCYNNPPKDLI